MFLNSSLPTYAVAIIIVVVAVQYALALFCLLKLAYLDIPKKQYVLWNVLILIVFFIGAAVFLVYYSKVKDAKRIPPYVESETTPEEQPKADEAEQAESAAEKPEEPVEMVTKESATESGEENSEESENADAAKD